MKTTKQKVSFVLREEQKVPSWEGIQGVGGKRKILSYNPKLKELAGKLRKNMTLSETLLM
ncbi:MAG: hypothetical protein HKUEN01_06730 [Candidatus Kuenenia stuttgartiensis]|nr:MAG: hypothetical protein CV080_11340 [Candidatus Kuenenia stuttgartiensis]GJQ48287.1 MAG: hypothetical protein HKUEN01_06730 [Candidatus Kuenenia stuttgartiensis]